MTVFKCKMCGGNLSVGENAAVGTCQHCGSTMTLPRLDSDWRQNLYDRAGHFLRAGDYDKAMSIYERVLDEDKTDAEAYWSLVLCRYGVEYVEDPKSGRRLPTCNRTQASSIFADPDYKAALQYAPPGARELYEAEAKQLDEVLKGILAISSREEPFDVFICYKESDERGARTPDSVLAQELYTLLTKEGFKVFFSRITLEDKLGSEYEPYIYAALNSARVMVVVGTKPDHFQAAWVKNEWGRYLQLIKAGEAKTLIPAYRDMDPYDLPEEFSHLQAQDMGKLGFLQDLLRGIQKLLGGGEKTQASAAEQKVSATAESIYKRAMFNIEYEDWDKAEDLFEQALNIDHQYAPAYIGKLMAQLRIQHEAELGRQKTSLREHKLFDKALRVADEAYRAVLEGYEQEIADRKCQEIYDKAMEALRADVPKRAIQLLREIEDYADTREQIARIQEEMNSQKYARVQRYIEREEPQNAIPVLEDLGDYLDCPALLKHCRTWYKEKKRKAEEEHRRKAEELLRKKKRETLIIVAATIGIIILVSICVRLWNINAKNRRYLQALAFHQDGQFNSAIAMIQENPDDGELQALLPEVFYAMVEDSRRNSPYPDTIALVEQYADIFNVKGLMRELNYEYAQEWQMKGYPAFAMFHYGCAWGYLDATERYMRLSGSLNAISCEQTEEGDSFVVGLMANGDVYYTQASREESFLAAQNAVAVEVVAPNSKSVFNTLYVLGDDKVCNVLEITDFSIASVSDMAHTIALSARGNRLVYRKSSNEVWTNDTVRLSASKNSSVVAVAGETFTCVLTDDHVVHIDDESYELITGPVSGRLLYIAAGKDILAGLTDQGEICFWGQKDGKGKYFTMSGDDVCMLAVGDGFLAGLQTDGTVLLTGPEQELFADALDWTDVAAVYAGDDILFGVLWDGSVRIAGSEEAQAHPAGNWTGVQTPTY